MTPKYTNPYLRRMAFADAAELALMDPAPVPVLLEEPLRIAEGERVMVHGLPNTGKTWIAMAIALGVAARGGTVLFICAEGLLSQLAVRLRALATGLGIELASLSERFVAGQGSFRLVEEESQLGLARLISEVAPDLVVLDPLVSFIGGVDENSAAATHEFFSLLDELVVEAGCAVLLLHHSRKKGDSYRGSSAMEAWLDSAYAITSVRERPPVVVVENTKQRWHERREPFALKIEIQTDLVLLARDDPSAYPRQRRARANRGGRAESGSDPAKRTLDILHVSGEPLTTYEIRQRLSSSGPGVSGQRLEQVLHALVDEGLAQRVESDDPRGHGRKKYRAAQ